jgi:HEPN domain-containing protein
LGPNGTAAAWYHQAYSDAQAAIRVLDKSDPATYCQALSKHQQVVEKAVKAVAAGIYDVNIARPTIRFSHDISTLINVMTRLPGRHDSVNERIGNFALNDVGELGQQLMALAPRANPVGLLQRNTEYPFNLPNGDWTSPAASGSFDLGEVEVFAARSQQVLKSARKIIDLLQRLPGASNPI